MANWDITKVGTPLEFDTNALADNASVPIDSTHALAFWQGDSDDGFCQVFNINTSTWAVTTAAAWLEFDTVNARYHVPVQIDTNHWFVGWSGEGNDGYCQVFAVDTSTWAVTTAAARLEFDTYAAYGIRSVMVDSAHAMVFWQDSASDGRVQVIAIDTSTWAVTTAGAQFEFNTQTGTGVSVNPQKLDDTHFLFVYQGPSSIQNALVLSVNTSTWAVSTAGATLQVDTGGGYGAALIAIDSGHFFLAYSGTDQDAFATVLSVNTSTWAVSTATSALEFDTDGANFYQGPTVAKIDTNHFMVVWDQISTPLKPKAQILEINTSTWAVSTCSTVLEVETQNSSKITISSVLGESSKLLCIRRTADGFLDGQVSILSVEIPSSGYTLTAAHGSFTLTGQSTTLTAAYTITASSGSFTLTGKAADLLEGSGYYFTVEVGSFSITGQDATLQKGYPITAAQGSYTLTGQDATLTKTSAATITAEVGSFALTGQAATFAVQRFISMEHGTLTITGQLAGTTTTRTIAGDAQTYNLAGQAATITTGRTLTAEYGSFTITGQDASMSKSSSYVLAAEYVGFTISGQTAGITATRTIGAEHGTYTLTGYGATATRTVLLSAGHGAYTLTGQDATLSKLASYMLIAEAGSFTITGLNTAILRTSLLSPEVGNYTLTGQGSGLQVARIISAGQGAYTLTGEDAQLLRWCTLSAENATYTLSPQAAAILGTFILQTDVQTYTLTGYGAVITQAGVPVVLSKKGKIVLSTRNTKMPLLTRTQRTKLFNRQTDIVC